MYPRGICGLIDSTAAVFCGATNEREKGGKCSHLHIVHDNATRSREPATATGALIPIQYQGKVKSVKYASGASNSNCTSSPSAAR